MEKPALYREEWKVVVCSVPKLQFFHCLPHPMFSGFGFFGSRALGCFLRPALAVSGGSCASLLGTYGNPLLRWSYQSPLSKLSGEPRDSVTFFNPIPVKPTGASPFSNREGENISDETDEFTAEIAATVSSLFRSIPLSDLNVTLVRSGLLPVLTASQLSSVVNLLACSNSFEIAWSLILSHPPAPLSAYASLFRHYSHAQMPYSAIRTFLLLRRLPHLLAPSSYDNRLELLLEGLCKEGHTRIASNFLVQLKSEDPKFVPSVHCYNILLHGWFRLRKLKMAERLWSDMRCHGILPTVDSYSTIIEGLCRMQRPDQAMDLLEEMKTSGIDPNLLTCNPIVDSLSKAGRFKEALGFIERFPLFGISPNISTYNSLIKGFCKNGDLKGASNVLKIMIGRDVLPTSTTYSHYFRYFANFDKIEEGMNLYSKMLQFGYVPDHLTYQLLIKTLFENQRLEHALQLIKDMNRFGFEMDLPMSTMLLHLLCRLRRFEEACYEFEKMLKRGLLPQYVTYHRLINELRRVGLIKLEEKLSALMDSVPHSTTLPATYSKKDADEEKKRRKLIMVKAQVLSEALKECKDTDEVTKLRTSVETLVERANKLMEKIRRRVYGMKSSLHLEFLQENKCLLKLLLTKGPVHILTR